jgi:hypothetical protein
MTPGDLRASLLRGADYLDGALDAQLGGDVAALLHNLEVLRAIVQVALDQLNKLAPSENRVLQ